ncbi:hypothetical protein CONCODRAFT_10557 [Conidiobolus coronatus NRRL 28638]|uniref:Uncharacterized protein n=1 Tax=Conidiobolus coronatus (strain ATCC 28846 / CBS 209.66 / NRRL 28638) TaxID=796925 RepID=A0A137NX12_CONC2|nr:hypothetical protein CONCODRAFT_10557 [Conidiobolus coronatus NRRL 28638]|eukprot:KXN67380.1 hypothetical protein CONCODRAFT_10557 [Conidiobolus coronatus NRRL 28638]
MFKYLIISLIPFTYQAAYKVKCYYDEIEKVQIKADTYENSVHYMVSCYNYDPDIEYSCPEALNIYNDTNPAKKCNQTSDTDYGKERVVEFNCCTKAKLDYWRINSSNNGWKCVQSAVA